MPDRITVLLKINGELYKALSILFSSRDASFFVYDHFKDEKGSRGVFPSVHLLKSKGDVMPAPGEPEVVEDGSQVKVSFHPNRVYLKSRGEKSEEKHLWDEAKPQPFNKKGYRFHMIYSPPPPEALPLFGRKSRKGEEVIEVPWSSSARPEISLYEFADEIKDTARCDILPKYQQCFLIAGDDLHPTIALHVKETGGANPDIWRPMFGIFARVLKKRPIKRTDLERIIAYNQLSYDISSIPDDDVITNFQMKEMPDGDIALIVEHTGTADLPLGRLNGIKRAFYSCLALVKRVFGNKQG